MNSSECKELIKKLSDLSGVSGYEHNSAEYISGLFKEYTDNVYTHTTGNLVAVRKNDFNIENPKKVMVEAHMDEIGLMVSDIDENGFLKFVPVGGIDARILPAMEVTVHGSKDISGIIGAKPPHILSDADKDKKIPFDMLYIDTGYSCEEVKKIVSIGDVVTFYNEFLELKGDFVSTKAQDDRTSVAVLIYVLDKIKNYRLNFDVYFVATVQEEIGLLGAKNVAYDINPDCAVSIDVCHGATPDGPADATYKCSQGTVVTKGPNIHPLLVRILTKAMDESNVKYSIDIEGGNTGTNAWAVQIAREGIPTVLLSIPLKYMHTPIETLSVSDVISTADGICAFLGALNTEVADIW